MRALFWNRILIDPIKDKSSLWAELEEPKLDIAALEALFSQKQQQLGPDSTHKDDNAMQKAVSKQALSYLDGKRSQAVGILLGSCRMDTQTIAQALYSLDSTTLKTETLRALYNARGSNEELALITAHVDGVRREVGTGEGADMTDDRPPLAKPDEFLYNLSLIHFFAERAECWLFKSSFAETSYDLEQKIACVRRACDALENSSSIARVLGFILALGNYLNAGTSRGQADGFGIEILPLLRDVKSQDGRTTLLAYAVHLIFTDYDTEHTKELSCPLPEGHVFRSAAAYQFEDIEADLRSLDAELGEHPGSRM